MFADHRPGRECGAGTKEARPEHERLLPPLSHNHLARGAGDEGRQTPSTVAAASTAEHANESWQTAAAAAESAWHYRLPGDQQHLEVSCRRLAQLNDPASLRISPHCHKPLPNRSHKTTTNLPKLSGRRDSGGDTAKGLSSWKERRGEGGVRLRVLLAHHPASIAQSGPAMRAMLSAYGEASSPKHLEEYAWSEVFPLVRIARKLLPHDRLTVGSRSVSNSSALLSMGRRSDADEDRVGGGWEFRALDVKLPPIV